MFSSSRIDDTSADQEGSRSLIREDSSLAQGFVWVAQLARAPACKTGNPGSNLGPGVNFSLELAIIIILIIITSST